MIHNKYHVTHTPHYRTLSTHFLCTLRSVTHALCSTRPRENGALADDSCCWTKIGGCGVGETTPGGTFPVPRAYSGTCRLSGSSSASLPRLTSARTICSALYTRGAEDGLVLGASLQFFALRPMMVIEPRETQVAGDQRRTGWTQKSRAELLD